MFIRISPALAALWLLAMPAAARAAEAAARAAEAAATMPAGVSTDVPWWVWPVALFGFCFLLGNVAVLAGIGGGVLYVPLVSAFFPFHLDFVRGAGLFVALAGSLSAGPGLLKRSLATLRLTLPFALIASTASIFGAFLGLGLPTDVIQICLGVLILGIAALLLSSKNVERPTVHKQDAVGLALGIQGSYFDESTGELVTWQTRRTWLGFILFALIGLIAGMFGLGAGWANVPVLNLLMGVPLKVSVATSNFLLSITDTSAAWVYLNRGCVIPLMAIPSIVGLMLGAKVGVRVLSIVKPKAVRVIVILVLLFAGGRALMESLRTPMMDMLLQFRNFQPTQNLLTRAFAGLYHG